MKKLKSLNDYIQEEKKNSKSFSDQFDTGYETFKAHVIGEMIRDARKKAGYTQEEIANKIHTKKQAISRLEKHCENIKLSTLFSVANAIGKKIEINII